MFLGVWAGLGLRDFVVPGRVGFKESARLLACVIGQDNRPLACRTQRLRQSSGQRPQMRTRCFLGKGGRERRHTFCPQIPTIISGLTFLAAATSIPDAVSSMAVARKGGLASQSDQM